MRFRASVYAYLAIVALFVSCASAPAPAPAPQPAPPPPPPPAAPAPAPQPTPSVPAPDELRAKATELRATAFDRGLKDILPQDFGAADSSFIRGNETYGKDNAASAASYKDAVDRFNALIEKGMPLLAEYWRKKAQGIRDVAVGKSAEASFPELFPSAHARFIKAADAEAAKDYVTAVGAYKESILLYEILYKLCDAKSLRESIERRDFARWDPSNWTLAEGKYASSQQLYRGNDAASRDAVDEALLRYRTVVTTAIGYYAADRKTASETAMARAQSIKTQVASKEDYAAALALYQQGAERTAAKDDEAAGPLYAQAAIAFDAAYTGAKKKMDGAKSELDALDAELATAEASQ